MELELLHRVKKVIYLKLVINFLGGGHSKDRERAVFLFLAELSQLQPFCPFT